MEVRRNSLLALALVAATALAYAGVLDAGFVEYDDDLYVSERPEVLAGLTAEGWHWAWTSFQGANWFPLTRLSWMLDVELFGAEPAVFHATNLVLHIATTVLLFFALLRLTGAAWPAAFVAGVFALHPLHVESVAWISARKDVLSGLCFAGALWLHERRARAGQPVAYSVALIAALFLGLLAKPVLVTLPCVLLLLDYWPLQRLGENGRIDRRAVFRAVVEKLPLFALVGIFSAVTVVAQREGGALQDLTIYPLGMRVEAAFDALLRYLGKFIWPVDLAVFYPHPRDSVPWWRVLAGASVLFGMTGAAWSLRKRAPHFLVGWAWFVGMLVPVSGLVQVGQAALADRYTYLPLIGLAILVAWSVRALLAARPGSWVPARCVGAFVLTAFAWLSVGQVGTWRDGESLFRHAIAVTRGNAVAHTNLGLVLARSGRDREAAESLDTALAIEPGSAIARGLRGELSVQLDPERAAEDFRAAIAIEPREVRWRIGLGRALADAAPRDAEASLRAALALDPGHTPTHAYLAALLLRGERDAEAAEHYAAALGDPAALERELGAGGVARLHGQHAELLLRLGRPQRAAQAYERALQGGAREARLLNNFAWLLATGSPALRDPVRAIELAREAVAASEGSAGALDTLATSLAVSGSDAEANQVAGRALRAATEEGDRELAESIRARFPAAVSDSVRAGG